MFVKMWHSEAPPLCPWLNLELKMHVILNFRSLERAVNKYEIESLLKCCGSDVNRMKTLTFMWPWWATEGWAGDQSRPLETKPVVHIGENKEGCRNTSENRERRKVKGAGVSLDNYCTFIHSFIHSCPQNLPHSQTFHQSRLILFHTLKLHFANSTFPRLSSLRSNIYTFL